MRIPDMSRCEASLSAAYYAKKSKAADIYDHDTWLDYDGGHVRCKNKGKVLRRGSLGWVNLCGQHDSMVRRTGIFYPYLPRHGCWQPCCVSTWQLGVFTPSKRVRA